MSNLCSSNKNKHHGNKSAGIKDESHNKERTTVCIGSTNVKLWLELKTACKYSSDVKFSSFLLNLAQKHIKKKSNEDKKKHNNSPVESLEIKEDSSPSKRNSKQTEHSHTHKHSSSSKKSHEKSSHRRRSHNTIHANKQENTSSKNCDKGKEEKSKVKIKRKASEEEVKDIKNENVIINVNNSKESSKTSILDFTLPLVVVEKMNFNITNFDNNKHIENTPSPSQSPTLKEPYSVKEETSNNDLIYPKTVTAEETLNNLEAIEAPNSTEKPKYKHRKKHKNSHHHDAESLETKQKLTNNNMETETNDSVETKTIVVSKTRHHKLERDKSKRKVKNHDIRKAPQLNLNLDLKTEVQQPDLIDIEPISEPKVELSLEQEQIVDEIKNEHQQRVAIKIKLCNTCNSRHLQDTCQLKTPLFTVEDGLSLTSWQSNPENISSFDSNSNENIDRSDDSTSAEKAASFAEQSIPPILYLEGSESPHGLSVFARNEIKEYTQFGPLLGIVVKEVDIAEDSNMRHIWEVYMEKKNIYINTEASNTSNWMRYIRPAPTREAKNLLAISNAQQIFMVTTRDIGTGEELLYWQDDAAGSNKKKMEKTNCGGCNLTFTHPFYYRIHCSIFHDIRYSLTIRKYHCKICGASVLGKDNIMKHAVELHNGQGAYQCQFCKKFFLRLNYLEMHRTYGCAANPHRSRPLCDFCGRKFCQPQKLKVHIKRMHSDMSEVLREFQCKNCLKLLGSRAALQRHVKEVHQKQMDGSCTCVRCGKLFQNKSNLKIHMLTHSGVKPFKCKEDNCSAAFTTKQCLQFHYKKVHGFAEEIMPKIERSVEYTFAAYAGVKGNEKGKRKNKNKQQQQEQQIEENLMCMDESTDVDDISLDDKNLDDPQSLNSPMPIDPSDHLRSTPTPPMLEVYANTRSNSAKVQSKGSKKWLGEDSSHSLNLSLQQSQKDVYQFEKELHKPISDQTSHNIMLDVEETQTFDNRSNKIGMSLNVYNRHESSNASLLVEAALDSVSDIQISNSEHTVDVVVNGSHSQSCTDSLVNNLYSLSHQDNLPDVTYNHTEDLNESRDINLISPSVNDHISVTDHDLNDDLPNRGLSLDYNNLHHNEFSPSSSPNVQSRSQQLIHEYNIHGGNSPAQTPRSRLDYTLGHDSEIVSPGTSPPRYNFHHTTAENLSSDESNGIVAQNLSLNNSKQDKMRLDLSGYKSHYGDLDTSELSLRKYDALRQKFDLEAERSNKIYEIEVVDDRSSKPYDRVIGNKFDITSSDSIETTLRSNKAFSENNDHSELKLKQFEVDTDFRSKYHDDIESKYDSEIRSKQIEIDVELRSKNYDSMDNERNKTYESALDNEIRNKTYDVIDNLELRNKVYDNIVDEFRSDRNFEPLVLNPTELQGLDMSARSYHNFHTSGAVQGINRYHHIYSELERPSVDLRLGYSPPPPPYSHTDVLRVVSLDLTPPGRHSVDLSLRSHALHSHQLPNSRLLTDHPLQANRLISTEHNLSTNRILSEHNRLTLDQTRLLTNEHNLSVASNRLLSSESRLLPDTGNRLLSDHTTNRLLSNDQLSTNRMLSDETRLLTEQTRLLDQTRLLGDTRILQPTPNSTTNHDLVPRSLSPGGYSGYPVSPSPYHASSLAARTHGNSPVHTTATTYHHYSTYY